MVSDVTFAKAMAETKDRRRDLLLGNGFSIAAHKGFRYDSLYKEAVTDNWGLHDLFERLGTTNFEVALRGAQTDAERGTIRDALIAAVSRVHPRHGRLSGPDFQKCGQFLKRFIAPDLPRRGKLFTTNYDLLLYWVLMRNRDVLKGMDGFDSDGVWLPFRGANTWVYYLHGALHIRERPLGVSGKKKRTLKLLHDDGSLILQVRDYIDRGEMPVFVSEGTSEEKQGCISKHEYLRKARREFQGACREDESALFVTGHGLGDSDDHLLNYVAYGTIGHVYVTYFSPTDRARIEEVAVQWAVSRSSQSLPPVEVSAIRASECEIWPT